MAINTPQLGTESIGKLFFTMSLPMILSMLVAGLYNVVDALFIARAIGTLAIGGITIVLPIQMAIFSFSVLIGAGAASIVARQLGAKNDNGAMDTAGNALCLSLIGGFAALGLVFIFLDPVFHFLRVVDELRPYALDYLNPILWAAPVVMLSGVFNSLLGAEGKMQILMTLSIVSSVLNIVLDWVFIIVLEWGVSGAAIATVITQIISLFLVLYFYFTGNTHLRLQFRRLKLWTEKTREMILLGFPVFLSSLGVLILVASVNYALTGSSANDADYMIGAYGILCRVYVFVFVPMQGMITAYQTICGYNYGAMQYDRVKQVSRLAVKVTTIYASLCTLVMVFAPQWIFGMFTTDAALIDYGVGMSKLIFFGFCTTGAVAVWSIYFQATGAAKTATFLSGVKLYLFQLPALYIISKYIGVSKIWYAYLIADIAAFVIVFWVFRRAMIKLNVADKHLKTNMDNNVPANA